VRVERLPEPYGAATTQNLGGPWARRPLCTSVLIRNKLLILRVSLQKALYAAGVRFNDLVVWMFGAERFSLLGYVIPVGIIQLRCIFCRTKSDPLNDPAAATVANEKEVHTQHPRRHRPHVWHHRVRTGPINDRSRIRHSADDASSGV
jgi:hypothetical protein